MTIMIYITKNLSLWSHEHYSFLLRLTLLHLCFSQLQIRPMIGFFHLRSLVEVHPALLIDREPPTKISR